MVCPTWAPRMAWSTFKVMRMVSANSRERSKRWIRITRPEKISPAFRVNREAADPGAVWAWQETEKSAVLSKRNAKYTAWRFMMATFVRVQVCLFGRTSRAYRRTAQDQVLPVTSIVCGRPIMGGQGQVEVSALHRDKCLFQVGPEFTGGVQNY